MNITYKQVLESSSDPLLTGSLHYFGLYV